MMWKIISIGDQDTNYKFGGDDMDKIYRYFSSDLDVDTVDINSPLPSDRQNYS
jgi:hypothetical protein